MFRLFLSILACSPAMARTLSLREADPSVQIWSDLHETNREELLDHTKRLNYELRKAGIELTGIHLFERSETFLASLPDTEHLRRTLNKRSEEPAISNRSQEAGNDIDCKATHCLDYQPGDAFDEWTDAMYRNNARQQFCNFVEGVKPGKYGSIGFAGNKATCQHGATAGCTIRIVALAQGEGEKLGTSFAGNFPNCVKAFSAAADKCGTKSGISKCHPSDGAGNSFALEEIVFNEPDLKCQAAECKTVNCLTFAYC